jgi:two-component system response regulator FixJ
MAETVYIVDDDDGIRESLTALLELKGYAAKPFASGQDFLSSFSPQDALCVLADLRMPDMGGLDLQERLLAQGVAVPFIVITGHGDVPSAVRALKSGATDFIEKPLDSEAVLAAIQKAAETRRAQRSQAQSREEVKERIAGLTDRERDVLGLLLAGHPNKVIAYELRISPRTVENHRARLMVKMRVDSLAELVRLALAAGFEPPKSPALTGN